MALDQSDIPKTEEKKLSLRSQTTIKPRGTWPTRRSTTCSCSPTRWPRFSRSRWSPQHLQFWSFSWNDNQISLQMIFLPAICIILIISSIDLRAPKRSLNVRWTMAMIPRACQEVRLYRESIGWGGVIIMTTKLLILKKSNSDNEEQETINFPRLSGSNLHNTLFI